MRRLHIGGVTPLTGWEILDANPGPHVRHVGDAGDLARFGDGTFSEVYASHVLEHFDYKHALSRALSEWFRVLEPGGCLHLSVPDLATCCRLFLDPRMTTEQRFFVVRVIFGGHVDQHDYHQVAFDEDILCMWLRGAGFVDIRRVADLGLFQDTSRMLLHGVPISLNVVARRPSGPTYPATVPTTRIEPKAASEEPTPSREIPTPRSEDCG